MNTIGLQADKEKARHNIELLRWWVVKDLNLRPKDYESSALTN